MKKLFLMSVMVAVSSGVMGSAVMGAVGSVAGFEEIGLPAGRLYNNGGPGVGRKLLDSGGIGFGNNFNADFDWGGYAVSSVSNVTDGSFVNQYAAITGSPSAGTKYGVYYYSQYAIETLGEAASYIELPEGLTPGSVKVTNTTYAGLTIRDGDGFGFATKFGGASGDVPDYFKAVFTGYAGPGGTGGATGVVEFFLADYRFADNALDYIVTDWRTVDLTGLGAARSVLISFESSDSGAFGINTPTYLALDEFAVIPEPAGLGLVAGVMGVLTARRRVGRGVRGAGNL